MLHSVAPHDCTKELRASGLKITPARLAVLAALEAAEKPCDVEDIISFLKKKHVKADKVTVFRIIHVFSKKGLARPIRLYDGRLSYEYGALSEHHHFVCEQCGKIEMVAGCPVGTMEKDLKRTKGILVKRHSLEFFGVCHRCQAQ